MVNICYWLNIQFETNLGTGVGPTSLDVGPTSLDVGLHQQSFQFGSEELNALISSDESCCQNVMT